MPGPVLLRAECASGPTRFQEAFKKASQTLDGCLHRLQDNVDELLSLYQEVADEAFLNPQTSDTRSSTTPTASSIATITSRSAPPKFTEDGDVLVPRSEFIATLEHIDDQVRAAALASPRPLTPRLQLLGSFSLLSRVQATINP